MQVRIPVRLFALPVLQHFEARGDKPASSSWTTTMLLGADAVKVYSDEDPTGGLNGSRKKLEGGAMIDVVAVCRAYPRKPSGLGIAVEKFEELPA